MAALTAALPAQTAGGADTTTQLGVVEGAEDLNGQVVALKLSSPSTVTGAATNNVTISFRQVRGGSVQATLGSVTLASGTNLTAETPLNVSVSTSTGIADGDVIDVLCHQNGTGLALPAGVVAEAELV